MLGDEACMRAVVSGATFSEDWERIMLRCQRRNTEKEAHIDISMFLVLIYSPRHSVQCRLGLFAVCGRM